MASKALNGVFQRIRTLAAVQTSRGCDDRELVQRFLADDETAFTVLVERHGPMVLALCKRILHHHDDAEDACQATFLVLARKVGSLRKHASLSSWLHGIAYRICVNLKRQQARRQRREQAASKPAANAADGDITWRELRAVLDEELQRLPERYRAPLILCYLEGKTRDEAAHQLGCAPGALHGLLERGRKLLRDHLTQRGLTLSAALFATALSGAAAHAAVAPSLVVAAGKAALAVRGGQALASGLVAPQVLSLVKEASKVMFLTKLKIGAAVAVAAGMLIALAGGTLPSVGLAQDSDKPKPKAPAGANAVAGQKAKAATPNDAVSDAEFIRRISLDLRGTLPSLAEVHFFTTSKDPDRRKRLVHFFIQERQAKEKEEANTRASTHERVLLGHWIAQDDLANRAQMLSAWKRVLLAQQSPNLSAIQADFYQELIAAAKGNKDVTAIARKHLDQLLDYVTAHPKNDDVADAMLHISLVYRSLGKTVEADAWRDKLKKEHPRSPAARTARTDAYDELIQELWIEPRLAVPTPDATDPEKNK